MKTEIAKGKLETVESITTLMKENPVMGVVRVDGIPARQIQTMRANLRSSGTLLLSKKTFFNKALELSGKENAEALGEFIDGQVAFYFTKMNPFQLYRQMQATMTKAPAKGGELAPENIRIEKGDTSFKPGPIVGEFQKAGIPAAIEKGKIIIKKTTTPVKAGEPIPAALAAMLTKLDIFPLTVGLDLQAAYENGIVFTSDVLDLDFDQYKSNFQAAIGRAFNLSVNAAYPTPLTVAPIISRAQNLALNLAINAGIVNAGTLPLFIGKSQSQMLSIASRLKEEALDTELRDKVSGVASATAAAAPAQAAAPAKEEKPEEEEEEEEAVSEEEALAGLGALFG